MGKVRARSRKKLEYQFQETASAPVIENCSNYILFLQARVGCMIQ